MKKIVICLFALLICSCAHKDSPVQQDLYANDAERYLKNIVVKEKSESQVVYEYQDVRIDELSNVAAKYCNQFGKRAILEHAGLFRNNRMRATFICGILQ